MESKQIVKNMIFNRLDRIEDKLGNGIMAHEIPEIKDRLYLWQDGKLNDSYFLSTLNKFWDNLNERG
jgi:hypothetical protein